MTNANVEQIYRRLIHTVTITRYDLSIRIDIVPVRLQCNNNSTDKKLFVVYHKNSNKNHGLPYLKTIGRRKPYRRAYRTNFMRRTRRNIMYKYDTHRILSVPSCAVRYNNDHSKQTISCSYVIATSIYRRRTPKKIRNDFHSISRSNRLIVRVLQPVSSGSWTEFIFIRRTNINIFQQSCKPCDLVIFATA